MKKYFKQLLEHIETMVLNYYAPAPIVTHSISAGNVTKTMGMTSINFTRTAVEDNSDY